MCMSPDLIISVRNKIMYLFIAHLDIFFYIAIKSILLYNIYRNIKYNIKFFPPDKFQPDKNDVLHIHLHVVERIYSRPKYS